MSNNSNIVSGDAHRGLHRCLQKYMTVLVVCTLLLLAACNSQTTIVNPSPGTWRVVHSTNPGSAQNNLHAVAATSATDAWAVGSFSNKHLDLQGAKALIEHWNGSTWSVVASPTTPLGDSELDGVAAISPTDAWAVGDMFKEGAYIGQTLIEHWNGTAWAVVTSPSFANGAQLTAVAALSATDIWAVGYGAGGQTSASNPSSSTGMARYGERYTAPILAADSMCSMG